MRHMITPYQSIVYPRRLLGGNGRRCEPKQQERGI